MKFGSVCSGIEAASVAWGPLGWKAAWLSEIEPFPSAVLAHHYPNVPNLGDMTALPERILSGEVEAPDLFCGGTPCQAFSVAGLRNSLDDARGNLSLVFCEIANAIDKVRSVRGLDQSIIFWENVPGVLSTKDNAFGCFLGALAGEDEALVPSGGRWTNAGFIDGPQRAVAWRVLDAQYFGVAQRRRRVFVVASARADFDPATVLFEFGGVRRDTAPSRETGQAIAPCVTNGPPFSRTGNERVEAEAMVVQPYEVGNCLTARMHKGINSTLDEGQTPVISIQDVRPVEKAQNGKGWNDDGTAYTVDTHATQGVAQPIPIDTMNMTPGHSSGGLGFGQPGDPSFTLTKGHSHAVAQPVAFAQNQRDEVRIMQVAGALAAEPGMKQQTYLAQPVACEIADTLSVGANQTTGFQSDIAAFGMQVRRLTPVECERLQGFPDGYTNIPWRKKTEAPDGPRYKALGNSWAVPVVRWIGERIAKAA
jgi:DNA (cytosine-5)-methyltransferase 1